MLCCSGNAKWYPLDVLLHRTTLEEKVNWMMGVMKNTWHEDDGQTTCTSGNHTGACLSTRQLGASKFHVQMYRNACSKAKCRCSRPAAHGHGPGRAQSMRGVLAAPVLWHSMVLVVLHATMIAGAIDCANYEDAAGATMRHVESRMEPCVGKVAGQDCRFV